jgi:hypothetical protein
MRFSVASTRWAILLPLAALLVAGCGKAGPEQVPGGGPLRKLAPVAREGAVSVATRNTTRVGGATTAVDAASVARVVYPGLTAASRPQVVVLVNQRDWPAALAASTLAAAPLHAPILFTEGSTLPSVSLQALEAMGPTGAPSLGGVQVIRIATRAVVPIRYRVHTLPAAEPAQMAAAIEQLAATAAGSARSHQAIVLSSAGPKTLQMPVAGLSAESGAPILFADGATLPAATTSALTAMGHPSIFVTGSVASAALGHLARLGSVTNLPTGAIKQVTTAQRNSIAISRFTDGSFGWGIKEPGHGLVFASTSRPLDAPAAAPLSATGDYGPLLLLEGLGVLGELSSYLTDIQPAYSSAPEFQPVRGVYNRGWVIGDEQAISLASQADIDSLLEISPRKASGGEGGDASVLQAE